MLLRYERSTAMARRTTERTEAAPEAAPEVPVESTETLEASAETVQESVEITQTALERTAEIAPGGFTDAIREGASDAREAVAGFFPAIGNAIHKGVYNGFYYATYGVVFSALVVGRLIPSNNAMGEGVHDGFEAAKKDFAEREAAAQAAPEAVPMDEGLAPA
jgi:hypothetical protein